MPRLPRDAWIVLGGDALSALGSGLTLPFLLVYLHAVRGIGLGLAGLALSTIALVGLVGNPLGGVLSDRVGARNTLAVGLFLSAAGTFSLALVHDVWHAFAATALLGLGAGIAWPALDALLAGVAGVQQRSSIFALRHATFNAGLGLGAVVGGLTVVGSSPAAFELIYALEALSLIAFLFVLFLVPNRVGSEAEPRAGAPSATSRQIFRDRTFLRVWVLTALLVTVGYAQYSAAFPAYATEAGGLSPRGLSLAFAANTLAVVAGQLLVLRALAGRRRSHALALVGVAWACAWAVTLAGGAAGGSLGAAPFVLAMILLALGETLVAPTVPALVNDIAPEELRGRYNGVSALAWTSGFIAGPAIAGLVLAAGAGEVLFLGLIAACVIAAACALRLERALPAGTRVVPLAHGATA